MLKILIGKKGTGKTKTLIENVNNTVSEAEGNVVFISNDTSRHIYDIKHNVRMVDTSEFDIDNYDEFYGFVCGIVSGNFDITNIFVDSLFKIVNDSLVDFELFLNNIEKLSEKFNISFLFTLSIDEAAAPEYIKKYV